MSIDRAIEYEPAVDRFPRENFVALSRIDERECDERTFAGRFGKFEMINLGLYLHITERSAKNKIIK